MDIGIMIFPTDLTIQPVELAVAAESRGFESLWFPEHSHIPTRRSTPWGGRVGAPDLPPEYWRTHDQFIALAAAAAVTDRIKLATGITLLAQRDPLWLAKQIASLDVISGGRFLFGIGYGWNIEEAEQHGVVWKQRRAMIREKVLAMKNIWTMDEFAYEGELLSYESSWSWPKPLQKPHPPIILGSGAGPKSMADVAEFCDGWMPLGGRHKLDEGIPMLRDACAAIGRDPAEIELTYFGAKPEQDALGTLTEKGVTRAIFKVGDQAGAGDMPAASVIEQLDALAQFIKS